MFPSLDDQNKTAQLTQKYPKNLNYCKVKRINNIDKNRPAVILLTDAPPVGMVVEPAAGGGLVATEVALKLALTVRSLSGIGGR